MIKVEAPRAKKARVNSDDYDESLMSDGMNEDDNHMGGALDGDGGSVSPPSGRGKRPWKIHRHTAGSMHDANLYRHYRPDFRELAKEYPDTFGSHVTEDPDTGRATIDWKNPEAMRELTRVMLHHDFDIEWDVPLDRLCPPVANRLNYICWLADLMKLGPSVRSKSAAGAVANGGILSLRRGGDGGDVGQGTSGDHDQSRKVAPTGDAGTTTRPEWEPRNGNSAGVGVAVDAATGGVAAIEEGTTMMEEDQDQGDELDASDNGTLEDERKEGTGQLLKKAATENISCRGIDIGTGASCIYPLLGAKVAGWSFLATETDVTSAEWAGMNVRTNNLQNQITVRIVSTAGVAAAAENGSDAVMAGVDEDAPGPLLTALRERDGDFDFSMTNPPFFSSEEEAGQNPESATGAMATAGEVACPGGEEAFVRAIVRDSLVLKKRVRWYTSMIGRKSNAKKLLRVLREAGVKNTRTTEFFQGKTVRWGLAWSFTAEGMVGDKVPDDPSIKVFSKKKTAEKTQHSLRSFSVPLRTAAIAAAAPTAPESSTTAVPEPLAGDGGGSAVEQALKIVVPENLPADVDEVVARLRSSLGSSKEAHIQMQAAGDTNEGDISGGGGGTYRFRCEAYSSPSSSQIRPSCLSATAAAVSTTKPTAARNHHPTSPTAAVEAAAASGAGEGEVRSGLESRELPALLFAFELEVHAAAQWAGAAAAGASVRVWARLTDDVSSGGGSGGSRAIFQRIWEHLQQDALRQNRRWRREALRAGGRGRAAGAARGGGNVEGSG